MDVAAPQDISKEQLPNENLSAALGQKIASPNRLSCDTSTYANIIVGFPDLLVCICHNTFIVTRSQVAQFQHAHWFNGVKIYSNSIYN